MSDTAIIGRHLHDPDVDRCPVCGGNLRYGTMHTAGDQPPGLVLPPHRDVEVYVCANPDCDGTVLRDRP